MSCLFVFCFDWSPCARCLRGVVSFSFLPLFKILLCQTVVVCTHYASGFGRGMSCRVLSCCVFWDSQCSLVSMFDFFSSRSLIFSSWAVYYGFFSAPALSQIWCCSLSCVRLDARLDCPPLPCLHSPSWITASSLLILPCFVFLEFNWHFIWAWFLLQQWQLKKTWSLQISILIYHYSYFPSTVPIYLTCSGKLGQ